MAYKRKLYNIPQQGELDLRKYMDEILFGTPISPPKGQPLLIRKARLANNKTVNCTCRDQLSREADPSCSYCLGEGHLWDENWTIGYSSFVGADGGLANRFRHTGGGQVRANTKVFYFRYDTEVTFNDKIIEVKLDPDGRPLVPYRRKAIYKPQTIQEMRSDFGRTEFITIYCLENDAIRLEP